MRSLTSTLLAAQKSASAAPYVRAVFGDYHGDVSRLRFTRLYTGSETAYYSAVTSPSDGSLIRARIDPATSTLYTQRVTSPGPGSTFSSWTSHGTVSASSAVALAASGANVYLFYVDADTLTLKVKQSSDNGASYGGATTVAAAASAVTYLAAAVGGSDVVLFWTVGAVVWKSRFAGGAWGTPASWSNSAASIAGIACKYRADWNVVVCGTAPTSGDAQVWTCLYGDGAFQAANTWSALREVTTATSGANVTFRSPALEFLQHWRLFFVEKYTGSQAYSRLQWSTMNTSATFDLELWREPVPFDYEGDYGVAAANAGSSEWLSSPAGVWSAPSAAWPDLDVSADLIEAEVTLDEYDGRTRIVLRNPAAGSGPALLYSSYGSGALAAIRRGARLQLAAGYRTTAGAEASTGPAYWVESIELETGARPGLVVHAHDAWWLLQQWRARRQFVWAAGAKSVAQLIEYICARGGLDYGSITHSTAFTTFKPAFTIHPGEDGRTAVSRLLAMVPDEAIMRSAVCSIREPGTGDATDYAFGAGHAIIAGAYRERGATINRVRVVGAGVFSEGFDFAAIETDGERITHVRDLNLTSTDLAGDRASTELRAAAIRDRRDDVTVFGISCGQELYDVVALTDPQAGLVDASRRVLGLTWRFATGDRASRPRYDMALRLGSL